MEDVPIDLARSTWFVHHEATPNFGMNAVE
jgi:hypothetical protein